MQQIQLPPLAEGEVYLGGFVDANGDVSHTILLPGDRDGATWQEQMDWAKSIGGDLPNRIEQAMLYACHRDQFKKAAYWSNTIDDEVAAYAWSQDFGYGNQSCCSRSSDLRARAVRRLAL
jgi:hypothetical protein